MFPFGFGCSLLCESLFDYFTQVGHSLVDGERREEGEMGLDSTEDVRSN